MAKRLILKELRRYRIDTYADVIYRNALLSADKETFVRARERITFEQHNERVNVLVHALHSLGLSKGHGIGILSWNCLECTDVNGAARKGGFIVSPFNPRLQTKELDYIINYSEVKALFVCPELLEEVEKLRRRLPNVQHYVSLEGSAPGMVSHDSLIEAFPADEPDVDIREDDRFIIFIPAGPQGSPAERSTPMQVSSERPRTRRCKSD